MKEKYVLNEDFDEVKVQLENADGIACGRVNNDFMALRNSIALKHYSLERWGVK